MNKKTLWILLIISTVLSVTLILLNYFGITRLIRLHMFKSKNYIENYSKLRIANDKRNTKIVVETNDKNLKKIEPMLNSILDQTCKVDNIILLVPNGVKVPDYVKKIANIENSNIKNTLLKQKESNTDIIHLNPNIVYGRDFLENLVKKSEESEKNLCGKYSKLYKIDKVDINDIDKTFSDFDKFKYSENYKRL